MRAVFGAADWALLAVYLGLTLAIGFWRRKQTDDDYLIAGRRLSLPVFVATLVATWYGGILGVGEMTYRYGVVNWTTTGLPYYVLAIVFALLLAGRVRTAALYTIPDKLSETYDRRTALLGAAFAFVMVTPAPYVLMVGQLVSVVLGWQLLPAILVGTALSVIYVWAGGFQADIRLNVLQFLLMFGGFIAALVAVVTKVGGAGWLVAHLPPDHLKIDGGLGLPYVAVWFLIAFWTIVDPGFHQRCYAARTPAIARTGILVAVACWAVFDVLTTSMGLYARALMPDLPASSAGLAFPLLAERVLPPGLKGLFYIAMLATVMSTVISYTFLGAMTVGRDLIWRVRANAPPEDVPGHARLGLLVTAAVAIIISVAIPSVVRQWWAIGTVFVPGLLLPVVAAYTPRIRISASLTLAAMIGGAGAAAVCLASGWVTHGLAADVSDSGLFPFGVQPMYPGLAASAAVYGIGLVKRRLAAALPRVRGSQ